MGLLVPLVQVAGDRQRATTCDVELGSVFRARLSSIREDEGYRRRKTVTGS